MFYFWLRVWALHPQRRLIYVLFNFLQENWMQKPPPPLFFSSKGVGDDTVVGLGVIILNKSSSLSLSLI